MKVLNILHNTSSRVLTSSSKYYIIFPDMILSYIISILCHLTVDLLQYLAVNSYLVIVNPLEIQSIPIDVIGYADLNMNFIPDKYEYEKLGMEIGIRIARYESRNQEV